MTLALIAFAVAMDCTAVSAAYGLRRFRRRDIVKLAVTFGSFQAGTAAIGALGGTAITRHLGGWDSWIAFGLLLGVGGHMIYEAIFADEDEDVVAVLSLPAILALGVATSIDSLAVGASLPTLGLPIVLSAAAIGVVSFAMSFVGAWGGVRAGERFGPTVEVIGGIILIAIGVRAVWPQVMS
jgi:putative Mn2+ efflux pump MntP